jgi:predicted nucleic acid-binding protein
MLSRQRFRGPGHWQTCATSIPPSSYSTKSPGGEQATVRLLIDTNIFLEILLEQEHAEQARRLLKDVHAHEMFLTDFTLHSLGLILFRRQQHQVFVDFVHDMFERAGLQMLSLPPNMFQRVASASRQHGIDFDDAYLYVVAEEFNLEIVSFDTDFDRTPKGRRTPETV